MTKSELVDQVADRADLTKQDAARAVDAVLATVEDALRRGSEVTVSGFGKFHVSERGARHGRQSAHRRAHPDRRLARAPLHRGQRPEERGEGSLTPVAAVRRHPGRRAWPSASRRSCSASIRIRRAVAGAASRAAVRARARRRSAPAAAVLSHCRALIDATAEACVAVKLQLACFERLGAVGLERARRRSPTTRGRAACS